MPTQNRRDYIQGRARKEFRANKKLTDPDDIKEAFTFARDNLDIARAQRKHLCKIMTHE